PLPPAASAFPYTTLFRSLILFFARFEKVRGHLARAAVPFLWLLAVVTVLQFTGTFCPMLALGWIGGELAEIPGTAGRFFHARGLDRKSTRLNSSHVKISY